MFGVRTILRVLRNPGAGQCTKPLTRAERDIEPLCSPESASLWKARKISFTPLLDFSAMTRHILRQRTIHASGKIESAELAGLGSGDLACTRYPS
jgi:hypothetical protein